jgi:3-phosphoglycerate kinase
MKAKLSHISIGGGSTLELIEKGTLAGIEALKDSAKIFG